MYWYRRSQLLLRNVLKQTVLCIKTPPVLLLYCILPSLNKLFHQFVTMEPPLAYTGALFNFLTCYQFKEEKEGGERGYQSPLHFSFAFLLVCVCAHQCQQVKKKTNMFEDLSLWTLFFPTSPERQTNKMTSIIKWLIIICYTSTPSVENNGSTRRFDNTNEHNALSFWLVGIQYCIQTFQSRGTCTRKWYHPQFSRLFTEFFLSDDSQ